MQWELWGNNVVNTWLPCPVEREGHSKLEGQLNVGGTFKSCTSLNFIFRAYLLHPNYICMVSKICCHVRALDCVKGKGGDLSGVMDMLCTLIGVLIIWIHTFVKTLGTAHLRPGRFSVGHSSVVIEVIGTGRGIEKLKHKF